MVPPEVMVTVMLAVPVAPWESVAVSVMVWVPTERVDVENDVPVPIWPSRLLVQTSEAPLRTPSSGSLPEPWKGTFAPCAKLDPLAGAVIDAVGD